VVENSIKLQKNIFERKNVIGYLVHTWTNSTGYTTWVDWKEWTTLKYDLHLLSLTMCILLPVQSFFLKDLKNI
jgi:hypothetical protein